MLLADAWARAGATARRRAWLVTHVDWKRRRCFVEATDLPGQAKWAGLGGGLSFAITRGMRDVLSELIPRAFSSRDGPPRC